MQAVRIHRFGGSEELMLEQVPIPQAGDGEVLVRVAAAGVGPWDALIRTGRSGIPQPLPLTPGSDVAGTVGEAAVFGVTNARFTGGYAEYAVADAASIAPKPKSLGFVEAASAPVVAVTAWQMLFDHASVAAGQSVVVIGAAGSVGAYAVQLARWAGATVTGIASAADLAFVRGCGASTAVDRRERFEDLVSGADAVIDTVGGDVQARAFTVLRRGGVLVSSVSAPSQEAAARFGVRTAFFIVAVTTALLERIAKLFDDGTLRADVGTVLPLREARRAHAMLAGTIPHPRGKIVLTM